MKKYRSINKKIFLITCILLILSLVTMYSVIVYLMPKTFFKYKDYKNANILNELNKKCSSVTVDKSQAVFDEFIKKNTNNYYIEGTILFDKNGHSVKIPYSNDKYMDVVYQCGYSTDIIERDFINSFLFTVGKLDRSDFNKLYSFGGIILKSTFYEKELTFKNGDKYHFYMFVNNDSINEVSKVLYQIAIYILLFIVVISIIVSIGYSKFITKPILELIKWLMI